MVPVQLRQLLYLKTVMETSSIRKASERLFVSQQAISHALRSLEKEYGVQLLERSVYGVTLTPVGKHAVELGEEILARVSALEQYLKRSAPYPARRTLRIRAPGFCIDYVLPKAKVQLMLQNPEAAIEIQYSEQQQTINAVSFGHCDIGFISAPQIDGIPLAEIPLPPPEIPFTPLYTFHYKVLVGPNSPLNKYDTLTLKSILRYPVIYLKPQPPARMENEVLYRTLSHFGALRVLPAENVSVFAGLLRNDMGIAISSTLDFAKAILPQDIAMKRLRDPLSIQLGYITSANCSPLAQSFLQLL